MILEALEHLLTPCPTPWRRMGYLREQIAIDARLRRNRVAWASHLEASKAFVRKAADACLSRDSVLVLGAGLHHDLPLEALGSLFKQVILADLVHRPFMRLAARRRVGKGLKCLQFDASAVAECIYREGRGLDASRLAGLFAAADPGLPPELSEPDLVISCNLLSQIALLPLEWAQGQDEWSVQEKVLVKEAAARAHLQWLSRRTGMCVLISEVRRRELGLDGLVLKDEAVEGLKGLRPADATWVWKLAPMPELYADRHLEHQVCAWTSSLAPLLA